MKKLSLSILFLLSYLISFGQDIATVRTLAQGETVTIQGIITTGSEFGSVRYLQDESAGIAVFDSDFANQVEPGFEVVITGQLSEFNGLLQIAKGDGVVDFQIINENAGVPEPRVLPIEEAFTEAAEGLLIKLEGVTFADGGGTFEGGTNYDITDGTQTAALRIDNRTDIVGATIPTDATDVVGVMGEYKGTYQLLSRSKEDIAGLGGGTVDPPPTGLISISEARTQAEGTTVTVTGIVTTSGELGAIRYFQDETGGIAVYDPDAAGDLKAGDEIQITGQLAPFNELQQIQNKGGDFSIEVLSTGNPLPDPKPIFTATGFAEANEGMLVSLKNVSYTDAGGTFEENTNYEIKDAAGFAQLRVDRNTDIAGAAIPSETTTEIVGIMGQYRETYQLLPRSKEDLDLSGGGTVDPPAGTITIAEARTKAEGETVTVTGVILNGPELGAIRYFQDETGGLAVYDPDSAGDLKEGDQIQITGQLAAFNDLQQIQNKGGEFSIEVLSSGNKVEPTFITTSEFGEAKEGMLVSLKEVTYTNAGGAFEGNMNYEIMDADGAAELRVDRNTDIAGATIPSEVSELIIGIMGQYRDTYQLLPRSRTDLGLKDDGGTSGEDLISISEARQKPIDATVTVKGIVTNGGELGVIRYIQDETAGIGIYNPDGIGAEAELGDMVQITGQIVDFQGLLEIVDGGNFKYEILSKGNTLPDPVVLPGSELYTEDYEGMLVRMENVNFTSFEGTFAGRSNYEITDGTDVYAIRISTDDSDISGTPIPVANLGITGIMAQYQANYQLLPRSLGDIDTLGSPPIITSDVSQGDITTSGFSVAFTSNDPGNTQVSYGLTEDLELGTLSDDNLTTDHNINIDGLEPATLYYVQVTTTSEDGSTSTSVIRPMMTASLSSGKIDVYFNDDINSDYSTGRIADYLPNAFDDTLRAYILGAKESIDMCFYTIDDINSIIGTLRFAAENNGVEMRFVVDIEVSEDVIAQLPGEVSQRPPAPEGQFNGIMHNKFIVRDANSSDPNAPSVWTGATNFTNGQLIRDANNIIVIQDQSLAKAYTIEFEEMLAGNFGGYKKDNTPKEFVIGGRRVELFFSPSDNVTREIIRTVDSTDDALYFCILSFTRSDIANAMLEQANVPDLAFVTGLFNEYSGNETTFDILNNPIFGTSVIEDDQGRQLHHKYMIIDPHNLESDPLVLTGSHNWTNSAEVRNDENTLVIHDAEIANLYFQEFVARYFENGGEVLPDDVVINFIERDADINVKDINLYPNPVHGALNVFYSVDSKEDYDITITDMLGKVVWTQQVNKDGQTEQSIQLQVDSWPSGVYNVVIGGQTSQFVIAK